MALNLSAWGLSWCGLQLLGVMHPSSGNGGKPALSEATEDGRGGYDRLDRQPNCSIRLWGTQSTLGHYGEQARRVRFPRRKAACVHEFGAAEGPRSTAQWRPAIWMWVWHRRAVPGSFAGITALKCWGISISKGPDRPAKPASPPPPAPAVSR